MQLFVHRQSPHALLALRITALAVLYALTGRLGLLLAVPPGYATLLWPPSGIALGMLLLYGRGLWPGILIGSFILNSWVAGAIDIQQDMQWRALAIALCIAGGSTLQAVAGWYLVRRMIGLPLQIAQFAQVGKLLLVSGPIACLIAASIGIGTLAVFKHLPADILLHNWLSWWGGDVAGVLVFLPITLLFPGVPQRLRWNHTLVNSLPFVYVVAVILPLGLTFYAWKVLSERNYEQAFGEFELIASNAESALTGRLESYSYALAGGLGSFQSASNFSRTTWNHYVSALPLSTQFPGISGIGIIYPAETAELPALEKRLRQEGIADFTVHPHVETPSHYIRGCSRLANMLGYYNEDKSLQVIEERSATAS